jgi:putative (di)nucleoside polyphosphate hydrolase
MTDAFFRAGVGAVILDASRRILTLQRKGATDGAWQLPQGGIGVDEPPVEALYRELGEEIGLGRDDVEILSAAADWLTYELPVAYRNKKVGWGQTQRWYLCRLVSAPEAVRPDQVEFTAARWVTSDELLRDAAAFRTTTYRRLVSEFSL